LAVAAAAAVLFGVLLAVQPVTLDRSIHSWFVAHRWPPLTAVAIAVTDTATSAVVIPVIAVLCVLVSRGPVWRRLLPVVPLVLGIVARTWV
jgi:hypothetical protein